MAATRPTRPVEPVTQGPSDEPEIPDAPTTDDAALEPDTGSERPTDEPEPDHEPEPEPERQADRRQRRTAFIEQAGTTGRATVTRWRSGRRSTDGTTPVRVLPDHLRGPEAAGLVRRIRARLFLALILANLAGITAVAGIVYVLPGQTIPFTQRLLVTNLIVGAAFVFIVIPAAVIWGETWLRSGRRWLHDERAPTDREVSAVLRAPFRLFLVHLTAWFAAAFTFSLVNTLINAELLPRIAFTVALGGLLTSGVAYLFAERITRPLAAAALSMSDVAAPQLPGVVARTLLGWLVGTGVALFGLVIVALFALTEREGTATQLAVTMLVLASIGLVAGWWVTVLGARAIADPVASVRHAMEQLAAGDLDTRIEVYDGSVLGLLQAGFNDMATGLQERERLRDLYGKQVGEDVAADSISRGVELGGSVQDVAVLFVDVVGSTSFAATRPAEEVVALLNRFFGVVVDEVHRHHGWINKFQGDATLAVFGAPAQLDDAAG
ncbi:MAG: adenylate/guanylate cyclase domain-containing protein, partial [Aquihabitans sp.]